MLWNIGSGEHGVRGTWGPGNMGWNITPSEVYARDFASPPAVATFLSNFQSWGAHH